MKELEKNNEKEIDLTLLIKSLWSKRLFIVKISVLGLIVGVIVAFSIPREYVTEVVLAPEYKSDGNSRNVSALAAAVTGVNITPSSSEMIPPELFPAIINSTPFIMGLFDINVVDDKNEIDTVLFYYIQKEQKSAWWSYILGIPSQLIGFLFEKEDSLLVSDEDPSGVLNLTRKELAVLNNIKSRLTIEDDKTTGLITLKVKMQSPEISAYIADTVVAYLQAYVINYRTEKARQDLIFTEGLFNEAKTDYNKAHQAYASFLDENINVTSARYRTTQESLQNELSLTYGVYNQMAQQLQMAKVKVQNTTPVYSVIQPAVVPHKADSPNKKIIVIGFIFMFGAIACAIVLFKHIQINHKNIIANL